ncbi:PhoH family protein [uncultured Roseibium sp.]|uniref:PhoH family protein n=1 Tax=uncultured Roseibium sp. TaxID=1936171 RepID=UPI00261A8F6D|nr:PhoH family protein [uncultured Roseibium sp.]
MTAKTKAERRLERKKKRAARSNPSFEKALVFTPPELKPHPRAIGAQTELLEALEESEQVVVTGPAGTGKTYVASRYAAKLLQEKRVRRIILSRPFVASGQTSGFLPGTLEEKAGPWLVELHAALKEQLGAVRFAEALRSKEIEVVPFEYMRGRSFKDSFVLLDEAQNTTPHEMKMFVTRTGDGARVVINGDVQQSDLGSFRPSGLSMAVDMVDKGFIRDSEVVHFATDDIVRSGICKDWAKACERTEFASYFK